MSTVSRTEGYKERKVVQRKVSFVYGAAASDTALTVICGGSVCPG